MKDPLGLAKRGKSSDSDCNSLLAEASVVPGDVCRRTWAPQ